MVSSDGGEIVLELGFGHVWMRTLSLGHGVLYSHSCGILAEVLVLLGRLDQDLICFLCCCYVISPADPRWKINNARGTDIFEILHMMVSGAYVDSGAGYRQTRHGGT